MLSRHTLCLLVALISICGLSTPMRAADWEVGTASTVITPKKPIPLAGYAARIKPFEKVDQDILTKALAIKDSTGQRAVIVTVDICILPKDVADPVRKRIAEKAGLSAAAVLIGVSHTHSGPAVSLQAAATPGVNPGSDDIVEYTKWLQDQLVTTAEQALGNLKPARLSFSSGIVNFPMNRRQFTDKGVVLGVNPRGPVDRSVPILRIDTEDAKLMAVLFGCACHGTTVPSNHLGVCGDYAGFARSYIEQQNPGVAALFMAGCGGDANPIPRTQLGLAERHGEELGKEVCRALGTKQEPIRGPLKCAAEVASFPLQKHERAGLDEIAAKGSGVHKQTAQQMLAILARNEKPLEIYQAPVSVWQFGKDLTLVGLPEEVVVDYVSLLENALGPMRLWVAAYCHEVTGYLPSKRVLKEGGYETRGLYIDTGWFAPEAEDELLRAATQAAKDAGRPLPATK